MNHKHVIERYAELIKEEPLSTVEPEVIAEDTFVLESAKPFFGYYHDDQLAKPDPYLYCVLDRHFSLGEILRITARVNGQRTHPFDASVGTLTILNQTHYVIRIRDITRFCRVKQIQELFRQEGVEFKKRQRTIKEQMGIIHLSKFLHLRPQGDGLFFDVRDTNKGYFTLPHHLDWESFKELTTETKYDTDILFFDAAQAMIYHDRQVVELVRIYRENLDMEKLRAIRNRYLRVLG